MRPDEDFAPLRIVRRNVTDFDRSAYRVYKSTTEYVTVAAATALEAFRESGIRNPVRIVRETRFMERLLDEARFSAAEEVIETGVIMEPPASIAGHSEAVPQAPRAQASQAGLEQAEAQEDWQPFDGDADKVPAKPEGIVEAEAMEAMAAPVEAPLETDDSELSEDEISKLLGDGES